MPVFELHPRLTTREGCVALNVNVPLFKLLMISGFSAWSYLTVLQAVSVPVQAIYVSMFLSVSVFSLLLYSSKEITQAFSMYWT